MSYDFAAFDPVVAPTGRDEFIRWYEEMMAGGGESPVSSSVRRWVELLQTQFPDIDELDDEADEDVAVEYSGEEGPLEYVGGAWSAADRLREAALRAAQTAGVGVFLLSDSPAVVWLPQSDGSPARTFEA